MPLRRAPLTKSKRFSDFMRSVEDEARVAGSAARAELDAYREHFSLARGLAQRRKALGLTQAQLARRVGLRQSDVSRLESGETNPTWSTLMAYARALQVRFTLVDDVPQGKTRRDRSTSARRRARD